VQLAADPNYKLRVSSSEQQGAAPWAIAAQFCCSMSIAAKNLKAIRFP